LQVLSIIDAGINSVDIGVNFSAVHFIRVLIKTLSAQSVLENINFFLFSLFALLELKKSPATNRQFNENAEKNGSPDFFLEVLPTAQNFLFESSYYTGQILDSYPLLQQICLEIIVDLWNTCPSAQPLIYIPSKFPVLDRIREVAQKENQRKSLTSLIAACLSLCQYQSFNVRFMGVKGLLRILSQRKEELYSLLSDSQKNIVQEQSNTNTLAILIQQLLQLVVTVVNEENIIHQKKERLLITIIDCLGELGCIDMSYLIEPSSHLSIAPRQSHPTNSSGDLAQDSIIAPSKPRDLFPWTISDVDFGLVLLKDFFVISLKSAQEPMKQDFSGFAIQQLLQTLSKIYYGPSKQPQESIPKDLEKQLQRLNVLDITEPFFGTKYVLKDGPTIPLPLYCQELPFHEWIASFTKYILSVLQEHLDEFSSNLFPFKNLFLTCTSLVKFNSSLCQFLIPFLFLDFSLLSLITKDKKKREDIDFILSGFLKEYFLILTDDNIGTEEEDMTPQEIRSSVPEKFIHSFFAVYDIYISWISEVLKFLRHDAAKKTIHTDNIYQNSQLMFLALNKVITFFPLPVLSAAANSSKSYARALLLIEMDSRNCARLASETTPGTTEKSIVKPKSLKAFVDSPVNFSELLFADTRQGILTSNKVIFSENQILLMAKIFGNLGEVDSLQGINIVRRNVGFESSLHYKIIELSQSRNLLSSLLEYELIHSSAEYQYSLDFHQREKRRQIGEVLVSHPLSVEEMKDIQRGKSNCLMELGHLETLINGVTHANTSPADYLKEVTLSFGIEAAWRLG
jgi:hypothetical protein